MSFKGDENKQLNIANIYQKYISHLEMKYPNSQGSSVGIESNTAACIGSYLGYTMADKFLSEQKTPFRLLG
ncbi:hypothetical protein D1614_18125 [Maribellus luteus]|uniref:Uncharacterized protein n=1 Tax=Maribellus luteus TaxID=2305463 RepID=A0A399SUL7_9BACT|nr:hypothetical protein [Maribellus luteus]RIJ46589.1 hypothetical protein D1614_18125 [Maribellus luteus]